MASQFEEVAELIGRIQVLKNQLEETSASIQKQSEANSARLKNDFDEIEGKVDKFLNKAKELTRITNSHYWMVAGGAFLLGVALSVIGCFSFSNWINKDIIETRAELKIEQEQLKEHQTQIAAVASKYERYDKYDKLLALFDKMIEKDEDAISIFSGRNYLDKTLKDTTEDVLVLNVKSEFMSDCSDNQKQKCYRNPNTKDYSAYDGFYKANDGSYVMSFKKNP